MNTIRVSNRLDPDQAQHVVTSAHSLPKNMLLLLKNTKIIKKNNYFVCGAIVNRNNSNELVHLFTCIDLTIR